MNKQKQFTELEKFQIQIHITDLEITRNEVNQRLDGYLKIISTFLLIIFLIFGYAVNEEIKLLFLLLPAFILSGIALILNKLKNIYSLGVYYNSIEEKINKLFDEKIINWEEMINQANKKKDISLFNIYIHFIILLPIFLLYLASLIYLNESYENDFFMPYVIVFYSINISIIIVLYYIFGKRKIYVRINQILDQIQT